MPLFGVALLTMTAAQLLDLGTFLAMVRRLGLAAEANPLVAALAQTSGLSGVVIAKLALVALVASVAVGLSMSKDAHHRRVAPILLGCAIVAGLFGGWSNALTIGWL
jgi:uncharacterized membrane protein